MPANRLDAPRPDTGAADRPGESTPVASAPAPAGLQPWLPLLLAVLLLPLVAYAITSFVLVPKLQKALGHTPAPETAAATTDPHASSGHGAPATPANNPPAGPGGREQVAFSKLLVNVAGTMGSRLLMASATLVSNAPDFKNRVARHEAQLRDTACGILGTKTLADLERPGARNIIRSELITAFNNVFGDTVVQEIYFTEFAIQ
ncbi:MAG: flagellar basal body-associated FliL family protein [Verrucomicrobiales bacterium]|nr:flagellar basal body-associated FliL family protein [Verrucomicrobiales bacterium]